MTTLTSPATRTDHPAGRRRPRRWAATATLGLGGLLLAAGGGRHPQGSGATVQEHLASMLSAPTWGVSHALLVAGTALGAVGLTLLARSGSLTRRTRRWSALTAAGWVFGTVEMVVHLLAAGDAHHLEHGEATPVLDLHVLLSVGATPLTGLLLAVLAVLVARDERTWPARLLAAPGVVGGLGYGVAAPLVVVTDDVAWTALFPLQAGMALWLVGTALRLALRRTGRDVEAP
ncbi:hypothetical protein [Phycicoccus avicenniae]|uniref:hypothetical protein n=1 Tax=Phycicoccus avicenniae TaxID=2828860 RepID=UPI003D28E984